MTPRPSKYLRRALELRLQVQTDELATCDTAAKRHCVDQAIADTRRQLAELGAAS